MRNSPRTLKVLDVDLGVRRDMHPVAYSLWLDSVMPDAAEHQADQVVLPAGILIVMTHQQPSLKVVRFIQT